MNKPCQITGELRLSNETLKLANVPITRSFCRAMLSSRRPLEDTPLYSLSGANAPLFNNPPVAPMKTFVVFESVGGARCVADEEDLVVPSEGFRLCRGYPGLPDPGHMLPLEASVLFVKTPALHDY